MRRARDVAAVACSRARRVLALRSAAGRAPATPTVRCGRRRSWTSRRSTAENCAGCHGADGRLGAARRARDPVYLALVDDATLRARHRGGRRRAPRCRPSRGAPAARSPTQQIDVLVAGMRARWARPDALAGAALPPYAGGRRATRGAARRRTRRTAPAVTAPTGDGRRRRAARSSTARTWRWSATRRCAPPCIVGRPDLGMPDWRGTAPADADDATQEVADVVAWLAAQRPAVPGPTLPVTRPERHVMAERPRTSATRLPHHARRRRSTPSPRRCWRSRSSATSLAPARRLARAGVDPARPARRLPGGPDAARDLPQSVHAAVGRRDRRTSRAGCGASRRDRFQVFAINCAHLGCPVRWFPESGLFMCPCHGGVYYDDGARASGPPPRGLYRVRVQDRRRPALGARRRAADAGGAGVKRVLRRHRRVARQRAQASATPIARDGRRTACRATPASWWYVFGSAHAGLRSSSRSSPASASRWSTCRRRTRRGTSLESRSTTSSPARLVPARAARLGLELHGRADAHPHDPGVPLRRLQVPARADLDGRRRAAPAARSAWRSPARSCASTRTRTGASASARRSPGACRSSAATVVHLLLGGPIIAGDDAVALLRAARVRRCPALLIALVGLHLLLVLRLGINEWPMPGRAGEARDVPTRVRGAGRSATACRSCPTPSKRTWSFAGLVILALVVCAAVFGPIGPGRPPDPTIIADRSRARLLLPVALRRCSRCCRRALETVAAPDRRRSSGSRRCFAAAVPLRHRREELAAPAGRGAHRHPDPADARRADLARHLRRRGRR